MRTAPRPLPRLPEADVTAPRSHTWLILAGVGALALLLLAGAGVALALHFLPPKKDGPPVASTTDHSQSSPGSHPDSSGQPPPLILPAPPPEPPWLPADKQGKVSAAIDRGIAFLESKQLPGGTWAFNSQTGYAALPGLTLLECGVSPDDPHIQKAATFVRNSVPGLGTTYELALAILFLDRLGDPKDDPLIRTMALRLMAGQSAGGGWSYNCPVLSPKDETSLLTILETTRPHTSGDLLATQNGGQGIDGLIGARTGDKPAPMGGNPGALSSGPTDEEVKQAKMLYDGLPQNLKAMPALNPPVDEKMLANGEASDNSNTQFAALGMWAAGRHGAPIERALNLLGRRFQISQDPRGVWEYNFFLHPQGGAERPSMTGAGLLGLAIGHGVTADLKAADAERPGQDPLVERGMKALAEYIDGMKVIGPSKGGMAGLYFMWSVERVGMLYGRRTIADKEWYPWGVDLLLPGQQNDGSWVNGGGYWGETPILNTCFALLFLKRANLAKDLSVKLQFLTQVKQP